MKSLFTVIKTDHRQVAELFKEIEGSSDRARKKRTRLLVQLEEALTAHTEAEEVAVYPSLKQISATADIGYEAEEEHGVVRYLFSQIHEADVDSEEWMARVTVLREVVEHHVKEEEDELFPKMRKVFSKEELAQMLEHFEQVKEQAVPDRRYEEERRSLSRVA
ncbi:hemerythrin domain-containing protein [bacterium]|nr:hemerythrin domain-containing protein [bacterium]